MPRGPHALSLTLTDDDRHTLESWLRRKKTVQALAVHARIVLACAAPGATNSGVAQRLDAPATAASTGI